MTWGCLPEPVPEISTKYVLTFMPNVGFGRLEGEGELNKSCGFEDLANGLARVTNVGCLSCRCLSTG